MGLQSMYYLKQVIILKLTVKVLIYLSSRNQVAINYETWHKDSSYLSTRETFFS